MISLLDGKFRGSVAALNSVVGQPFASIRNKALLTLIGLAIVSAPAWAVTFTSVNNSNHALEGDLVVGDEKLTTITGATPTASVSVHAFQNGTDLGTATVGMTDGSGGFSLSAHAVLGAVGDREDQWSVGGVQIADDEYEVIPQPTSVSVTNVSLASLPSGCPGAFGIEIDITYQISGAAAFDTTIPIIPYEDVTFFTNGGIQTGTAHGNIGPVSGYSTSSEFTTDTGVFHDVPVGTCANAGFSNAGASQTISMDIGDKSYAVRSNQRFVTASSSSGHGSITNNSDVSATR